MARGWTWTGPRRNTGRGVKRTPALAVGFKPVAAPRWCCLGEGGARARGGLAGPNEGGTEVVGALPPEFHAPRSRFLYAGQKKLGTFPGKTRVGCLGQSDSPLAKRLPRREIPQQNPANGGAGRSVSSLTSQKALESGCFARSPLPPPPPIPRWPVLGARVRSFGA